MNRQVKLDPSVQLLLPDIILPMAQKKKKKKEKMGEITSKNVLIIFFSGIIEKAT